MGSSNSKAGIHLQLDSYICRSDDDVRGAIYLHIKEPLESSNLYFKFNGKEKTHWVEDRTETVDKKGKSKTVPVHHSGKREIINQKIKVSSWPEGLPQGDYIFNLNYLLPPYMPGSFEYNKGSTKASISYSFSALLETSNEREIESKVLAVIEEPFFIPKGGSERSHQTVTNLKACGCNKGRTKLTILYSDDTYHVRQKPRVEIKVNNSKSKIPVNRIQGTLWRTIRIRDRFSAYKFIKDKIIDVYETGVPTGRALLANDIKSLEIDLPSVRDKIENVLTCSGEFIECSYHFEIQALMGSCCMSHSSLPGDGFRLTLIKDVIESPPLPPAPHNWSPQAIDLPQLTFKQDIDTDNA